MKKSADNIKHLLRSGILVELHTDDFRFSELLGFANLARSQQTMLTFTIGDNLNFDEVLDLSAVAKGYLKIIIP